MYVHIHMSMLHTGSVKKEEDEEEEEEQVVVVVVGVVVVGKSRKMDHRLSMSKGMSVQCSTSHAWQLG